MKEATLKDLAVQTELKVLGFLLCGKDIAEKFKIIELLEPAEFTGNRRAIYEASVACIVTNAVCDHLSVSLFLKNNGNEAIIPEITEIPLVTYFPDAEYTAKELRDRSKLRRITDFALTIQSDSRDEQPSALMKRLEDFVFAEESRYQEKMSLSQAFDEIISRVKEGRTSGFSWLSTLPQLTNDTNWIEPGKTYIIGATKKSGKTRLAVAAMANLILHETAPVFLSMEMRTLEVAKLFISCFTQVPAYLWEKHLSVTQEEAVREAERFFSGNMILDTQSYLTVEQVKAKVWRASQKGCKVVFIDFLQRMNFAETKNKNYATIVADTVARLADIGRDYNVAMVILSQLRNQAEGEEIADMRFLKDSGGIAENADAIITLTNRQRQESGEAKYRSHDKVDFWFSVEQRSGASSLIKAVAELGICKFYLPVSNQ